MAFDIGTIDAISRRLQRDVLQITFVDEGERQDIYVEIDHITAVLDQLNLQWELCAGFTDGFAYIEGGPGCIYIDIDPHAKPEIVKVLQTELNELNKTEKPAICSLSVLTLSDAKKNSEQDLPEFWENF